MGMHDVTKARLERLDARSQNLSSDDTEIAREILTEAMELYTLCKDTASGYDGKVLAAGVLSAATAPATLGISVVFGLAGTAYNARCCWKWEALKDQTKEVR